MRGKPRSLDSRALSIRALARDDNSLLYLSALSGSEHLKPRSLDSRVLSIRALARDDKPGGFGADPQKAGLGLLAPRRFGRNFLLHRVDRRRRWQRSGRQADLFADFLLDLVGDLF